MQYMPINDALRYLLYRTIGSSAIEETNARTKSAIRVLPEAYSFQVSLANGRLPVPGNRRYSPHIAAAETAWQLMGTRDPQFISSHAPKLWNKFIEDGELKSSYGWRWREAFGRDQLRDAIETLKTDPTSRQVYIASWDPRLDGLGSVGGPKNIPCPVGFTLNIIGGKLNMSVHVRSSDIFLGLPYDVMSYALTMDVIAATLGVPLGAMHFTLAHAHLYETHRRAAMACIEGLGNLRYRERQGLEEASTNWLTKCSPNLPGWGIDQVLAAPDAYVATVKTLATRVEKHPWAPSLEVIV